MEKMNNSRKSRLLKSLAMLLMLYAPSVLAHCDTLDGPVVSDARKALDARDVTRVLRWVSASDEAEIRKAFDKTLIVRAKGRDAKELADMYFFETLVRIHRAGEGAPYTGLKADAELSPAVVEADAALEKGKVDKLIELIASAVAKGLQQRFEHALYAKEQADKSVAAGRAFVAAYVQFVHYAEGVHGAATGAAALHGHAEQSMGEMSHEHPAPAAQEVKETEHAH